MTQHFLRSRAARYVFSIGAALGFTSMQAPAQSPTVIGSEAVVNLPQTALWEKNVNIRPGNGDVVNLNPPRFSWPAYWPMTNYADTTERVFQFQAGYDPTFNNLAVNVQTPSSMYNFLAPFTNSPVYWRVAYIAVTNMVTNLWITNSFSIVSNAQTWDRSMLANTNYLALKLVHPFMMFNSGNQAAFCHWMQTNTATYGFYRGYTGYMLTNMISQANQTITNSWWPGSVPPPAVLDPGTWSSYIANVAFVWQMTGNPALLASNPQQALYVCATNYIAQHGPITDFIATQAFIAETTSLALGYDWLYQVMTPTQREGVLQALELRSQFILYGYGCFYDPQGYNWGDYAPTNYVYPSPFIQLYFSQLQGGTSHEVDNFNFTMPAALAGSPEGTNCALLANLGLNYMIGCVNNSGSSHSDDGQDEGRGYGMGHLFGGGGTLYVHMLAQTIFPEVQFNLNPFWTNTLDFFDRWIPVGLNVEHDPWGDTTGNGSMYYWRSHLFGRSLAYFMGSGIAYQHWLGQSRIYGDSSQDNYNSLPFLFFFNQPSATADPNASGRLYTNAGWMISSTYGANTTNCFNNGVGLVFQARPQGSDEGHSYFSDLSFEIWAYGANVTDAGAGMNQFGRAGWDHYSLLVNGIGQCQPLGAPVVPYYSKFIGFEDTSNYTYVAADATAAYPHSNFAPGGWLIPPQFAAVETGAPLAFVQKVQRHILFMRRKYFVMYDDLQSLEPATFTWLYPVYPNTLVLSTNSTNISFSYTCTNLTGGTVTVEVAHIAMPQYLGLLDENGTNVACNPVTGENYWLTGGNWYPRAHTLWVSNTMPATNFHFMTVIYPVPPGAALPQITRVDDYSVAVTNGAEGDVISFDPGTTLPATMIINEPAIAAAGACNDVTVTTNIVAPPPPPAGTTSSPSAASAPALAAPSGLHIIYGEAPYVTPTITNGLLGWWRFDEGMGQGANDTSGAFNTGNLVNSPAWGPGVIGDALTFNGVNQYVSTANLVNTPFVTITAWVNIPAIPTNQQTIAGFDDGFDQQHEDKVLFVGSDGKPYFYVYASAAPTTSAPASAITPGTWTFVAGVFNGTNLFTYMNGVQVGSAVAFGNSDTTYNNPDIFIAAPIGINRFNYFSGSIDDVRVYNWALSPSELTQVYNWRGP